jgi:hypothetical protein
VKKNEAEEGGVRRPLLKQTSTALGWMRCEMLRVMDWLIWF